MNRDDWYCRSCGRLNSGQNTVCPCYVVTRTSTTVLWPVPFVSCPTALTVHGPHDAADEPRYGRQLHAVRILMADGAWRTVEEVSEAVGCSGASASARLRDIRNQIGLPVRRRMRAGTRMPEYRVETP